MFIIERALNVFTLIYELEAKIRLNESSISRVGLEGQSPPVMGSVLDSSAKRSPAFNAGLIPNQLILNASLLNELSQEEASSGDKNAPQTSEKKKSNSDAAKQQRLQRKESKGAAEPPSEYRRAEAPGVESEATSLQGKGQPPQSIPSLELSKIGSKNAPNIQARQQMSFSSMSSSGNFPQPQYSSASQGGQQTGSRRGNIPAASPRFVRINSNLVEDLSSSYRVRDPAGGAPSAAPPASPVYNNTSVQGASWRTVWPNSNLMSNGGIRDALASPVSAKSVSRFGASSPQQMHSPKSYGQANSGVKYTVMPNPSVVRYIEQKSAEGLGSPIGFSPLASPTYRKNVPHGRTNSGGGVSPPKSSLNNLTFSYKG